MPSAAALIGWTAGCGQHRRAEKPSQQLVAEDALRVAARRPGGLLHVRASVRGEDLPSEARHFLIPRRQPGRSSRGLRRRRTRMGGPRWLPRATRRDGSRERRRRRDLQVHEYDAEGLFGDRGWLVAVACLFRSSCVRRETRSLGTLGSTLGRLTAGDSGAQTRRRPRARRRSSAGARAAPFRTA